MSSTNLTKLSHVVPLVSKTQLRVVSFPWSIFNLDLNLSFFSMTAVANCHIFGDSKEQKFVLSWFWRPQVQNEGVGRLGSLSSGESVPCFSPSFSGLWAMLGLGLPNSILCLHTAWILLSVFLCLLCLSPTKTIVSGFRAHPNPEWSYLESLSLIISAKTSIPHKVTFWGLGWT